MAAPWALGLTGFASMIYEVTDVTQFYPFDRLRGRRLSLSKPAQGLPANAGGTMPLG